MQQSHIIKTIEQILEEGKTAAEKALESARPQNTIAILPVHARHHPRIVPEVAAAVGACLERLEHFLLESGAYQSVHLSAEAKRHVALSIRACVDTCTAHDPERPVLSANGYSQIEQLQDRLEAQADIIFHRLAIQRVRLRAEVHPHN